MGTKPGIKRHNGFVYAACSILIGLVLTGCTATSMFRPFTVSVDSGQQEHLNRMTSFIQKKEFSSAAAANTKILDSLENRFHAGDRVMRNYIDQTRLNQMLLSQILSDQDLQRQLGKQIQTYKEQQRIKNLSISSFKKKAEELTKKIDLIEKENTLLKQQIKQIKQIDLKPQAAQ